MSLRPRSGEQVPPLAAQVARANNPGGTTAIWVRDRLDGLWCDEDFADWYPRDGRPGLSPAQLATVCVLQFLLGLSDRQAAEAALPPEVTPPLPPGQEAPRRTAPPGTASRNTGPPALPWNVTHEREEQTRGKRSRERRSNHSSADRISLIVSRVIPSRDTTPSCSTRRAVNPSAGPRSSAIRSRGADSRRSSSSRHDTIAASQPRNLDTTIRKTIPGGNSPPRRSHCGRATPKAILCTRGTIRTTGNAE